MARRQAIRNVGRKRQRVEWTAGDMEQTISLAAGNLASLGSSVIMVEAIDAMTSPTLVRVRGEILLYADGGTAGLNSLLGSGMAVVNRRASAVGTTALPRPVSDPDFSWLWHSYNLVANFQDPRGIVRVVIDSKSMRKILSKEEEIVFCFENNSGTNVSIAVGLSVRILLKES